MAKKEGFTLVEMLAVITILGILVTVVLIAGNKVIKTSNQKYYQSQEKMITLASKEYFSDYRSQLPKEVGEAVVLELATLVKEKYIEEVMDVNENLCDFKESTITVLKTGETRYRYQVHLVCSSSNYETK